MSDPIQESSDSARPKEAEATASSGPPPDSVIEVDEQTPNGGVPGMQAGSPPAASPSSSALAAEESPPSAAPSLGEDDEPAPELVWYVLKVQSSREDTIRDALQRRVKIQGLQKYFGQIVVPTEKITEIRNNKKRVVERKTYPGYIMVQMELNEKTWFLVRETPGVGDFVGAHGTPTKMTDVEVNQMLHQEEEKTTAEAPKVRIDVERGDRVKIKDGPFENFEGTVEEVIEGRGLVKVMLIIFNRPTPVDLEYWQVERI
jgi:transcriptional antiterminator NusG